MSARDDVRGRWAAILAALDIPKELIDRSGKRPTCPFCHTKRAYSYTDHNADGMFYCAHCGTGNGFSLLMKYFGWDFETAAAQVRKVMGNAPVVVPLMRNVDAEKAACRRMWRSAYRVRADDPVGQYLRGRSITGPVPSALRYHPRMPYSREGEAFECFAGMIAAVFDKHGTPFNLHRTYLKRVDGQWKLAPIESAKRLMPGKLPAGSFIPLGDPIDGVLGIAEGIETALSAALMFDVVCWSAIAAGNIEAFEPPDGIHRVMVFGDNDASFTGQAAAFALAKRLRLRKSIDVNVHIPTEVETDWNDCLGERAALDSPSASYHPLRPRLISPSGQGR